MDGKNFKGNAAIVRSEQPSAWVSCQAITPNIKTVYDGLGGKPSRYFSLTTDTPHQGVLRLAEEIHAMRPSRIVFIDHAPHPRQLVRSLANIYGTEPLPPLYFHVYGDFTYYIQEWNGLAPTLQDREVALICASPRQAALVSRFVKDTRSIFQCPFPVNPAEFHFDQSAGRHWRRELGIGARDPMVLYTGRLSLQKNSVKLLRDVVDLGSRLDQPPWFVVAGTFDDLGATFFGIKLSQQYYWQLWQQALSSLDAAARRRVVFLGHCTVNELRGLYNAADVYASLSVHHDEDFGMSPAEALCSGCPVVLTDWGGYSTFKIPGGDGCDLLPLSIGSKGLEMPPSSFETAMLERLSSAGSWQDVSARRSRAEFYQSHLTIEAARARVAEIHATKLPRFEGFNWKLEQHAEMVKTRPPFPGGPRNASFYEEIYGAYVRDSHVDS